MNVTTCELKMSATTAESFPRDGFAQVAFMGRSNVGKSSLINRLLGMRGLARTSKTPGRTRAIHFYQVNRRPYFVDLPGYGYARVPRPMRAEWQGLIESYLEGAYGPSLSIVLVDARLDPTGLDKELVEWLRATGLPLRVVLTKCDKLSRAQVASAVRRAAAHLGLSEAEPALPVSAVSSDGVPALWRVIDAVWAAAPRRPSVAVLTSDDGGTSHRARASRDITTMPSTPARRRIRL